MMMSLAPSLFSFPCCHGPLPLPLRQESLPSLLLLREGRGRTLIPLLLLLLLLLREGRRGTLIRLLLLLLCLRRAPLPLPRGPLHGLDSATRFRCGPRRERAVAVLPERLPGPLEAVSLREGRHRAWSSMRKEGRLRMTRGDRGG